MYGMFAIYGKSCGSYCSSLECLKLEQFSCGSLMRYSRRVARAFLGSEARGQRPADIVEVVGNDSKTYTAMHARIPFIEAAAESLASLEHADAPFAADAPSLRFAEPALLLALATLRTLGAQIGNGDPCHSQLLRGLFVGSGEKSGVACHHARDHAEPLLMLFNRGDQQGRVRGSLVIHLVGDDDLVFRFLDFDHLAEFGGLARFSLRMISVVCSNRLTIL